MLTRHPIQSSTSLRTAYEDFLARESMATYACQMLAILPGLETLCAGLSVWGMTSHARLFLSPADNRSASPVLITPLVSEGYMVQYRLVDSGGLSPPFQERAFATTPDEALRLIAVAIDRSGWGRPPTSPSAA